MTPVNRLFALLAILALIYGCAATVQQIEYNQQATRQRQAQAEIQKIIDDCNTRKRNEPGLHETLSSKIPLYGIAEMTVTMMASTEKPTERERKMLLRSLEITMGCQKDALVVARNYLPPPIVAATDVLYNLGIGLELELYHGHFSYGEYNRKMKEAYTKHIQVIAQIEAELIKQNAEAAARAQQLANQQNMMLLNYLNSYNNYMSQQQQLQQSRMPQGGVITCHKMGAFTTCNY